MHFSTLLTLGDPEKAHVHCMRLMTEVSSTGFSMEEGCMLPTNEKHENVKTMQEIVCG